MSEVQDDWEEHPPPVPPKSPLRSILARNNHSAVYYDAHIESIDKTINEVESLWPLHAAAPEMDHISTGSSSPITSTSSDDSSSIYSFDEAQPTASSAASTNSYSLVTTPQSESPPPLSPVKLTYDDQPAVSTLVLDSSPSDPMFTTDDLFDLISQIPTVDNMRTSNYAKMMDGGKDAADCYMHSYFPPNPSVRPLLQHRSSGLSRTVSIISSSGSSVRTQQKRSSMLMPTRIPSLRFPSIKIR